MAVIKFFRNEAANAAILAYCKALRQRYGEILSAKTDSSLSGVTHYLMNNISGNNFVILDHIRNFRLYAPKFFGFDLLQGCEY